MPHPKPEQCVSPISLSKNLFKAWSEKNTTSILKIPDYLQNQKVYKKESCWQGATYNALMIT